MKKGPPHLIGVSMLPDARAVPDAIGHLLRNEDSAYRGVSTSESLCHSLDVRLQYTIECDPTDVMSRCFTAAPSPNDSHACIVPIPDRHVQKMVGGFKNRKLTAHAGHHFIQNEQSAIFVTN